MKVIAGLFKGLKLESGENEDMRPTKDRVKESLFDILQSDVKNKVFVDAFGGTGQIGIEALSRGAREVYINELQRNNFKIIKKNVSKIKNCQNIKLSCGDARDFLKKFGSEIDMVFLDPPYSESALISECMKIIDKKIDPKSGIVITETLSCETPENNFEKLSLQNKYNYGKISLNLYKTK